MNWERNFGNAMRARRSAWRWTQGEMAACLWVSQATICNWEYGRLGADLRLATRLARELGIDLRLLKAWVDADLEGVAVA